MLKRSAVHIYGRDGGTLRKYCASIREESTFQRNNYADTPQYPPILDTSKKAVERRTRESLYEKYKKLNTVEEKLFAINLPKYYGWNSLILKEGNYPYNFLPFLKQITKTSFTEVDSSSFRLIQGHSQMEEIKDLNELIRPQLQEAILFEVKGRRRQHESDGSGNSMFNSDELLDAVASSVIEQINRTIIANLSSNNPHLLESIVDFSPRMESFWSVGGFLPSEELVKEREEKKRKLEKEKKEEAKSIQPFEQVEHWVQYFGSPAIQVRASAPLPELELPSSNPHPHSSANSSQSGEATAKREGVEDDLLREPKYDPTLAYGLTFERRNGTNIPGFWPGEKCEFGLLSYHLSNHLAGRPPHFGDEDTHSTLHAQAILASFGWLHAQAAYQGFSTFHEVSYPLSTQTVVTDGHSFSFYLYQLNTVLLNGDHLDSNPRRNVCFGTNAKKLYQEINDDNQFVGWDDDVLSTLLACYLNKPQIREGVDMKPNVNLREPYLAHIEHDERRTWLHNQFRHMYSNRPRHFIGYEIYDWERIYKIKFPTRPMEARLRPFELDENPTEERRYCDHRPPYIPRRFREPKRKHWTGWRANCAKTYYPDAF